VPWLFPDSLRLESDTFSGAQVASGENWLLFTKTLGEIQIQEIVEAEPNRLDRLCTFSGEILERVVKESSEARIGCEKTLKNNTGPFFCLGDFIILVCSQFLFSQYPCTSLTTHSQVVFPHVFQRLHFHGAFSVTGQGHREEKIMEGQG
jgi:hypothetical protein